MSKGISPMIAVVLLIAFTVAVGGLVSLWLSGYVKSNTQSVTSTTSNVTTCVGAFMSIVNYKCSSDTSLVGYWKFDEGAGSNVTDASGNGNGGGILNSGNATWVLGKYGNALNFTNCCGDGVGSGGTVNIPLSSSLNISGNQISAEAWVSIRCSTCGGLIVGKTPAISNAYELRFGSGNSDKPSFRITNSSGTGVEPQSPDSISYNQWHHVVGTYDGNQVKVYVDGVLKAASSQNGNIGTGPENIYIGSRNNNWDFFNGTIDDVRIYNRALSPAEIQSMYQNGISLSLTISNDGQSQNLGTSFGVYYSVNGVVNGTTVAAGSSLAPGFVTVLTVSNMTNYGNLQLIRVTSIACNARTETSNIAGVVC